MSKLNKPSLNILVSYAYYSSQMNEIFAGSNFDYRLVIDSGAFTVWKKGKKIKVEDYCNFIESLPVQPWRYFNLDVIGDPQKTYENYKYMLNRRLNPIPIFTRGEDYSMIDTYYQTSDVVGIGGLVGTKNNRNVVKKVMRHVGNRKIHWLGFTSLDYMKHYKPYMCDSSSANMIARFGSGQIYRGNGKVVSFSRKDFVKKPKKELVKALTDLGFSVNQLAYKQNWKCELLFSIGYASAIRLMMDVKNKLDVNMFLAIPSFMELKYAVKQYQKLIKLNL